MSFFKRLVSKKQDEQQPPTKTILFLRQTIHEKIEQHPHAGAIRKFWHNLEELRDWWPILLPMLAWIGWRTYHTERQKVLNKRSLSEKQTQ